MTTEVRTLITEWFVLIKIDGKSGLKEDSLQHKWYSHYVIMDGLSTF